MKFVRKLNWAEIYKPKFGRQFFISEKIFQQYKMIFKKFKISYCKKCY